MVACLTENVRMFVIGGFGSGLLLLRLSSDEHGNHLPTPQSSFVADGLLVGLFMHEGGWKAGLLTTRVFEVSHVHPRVCHGMVLLPSSHLQVWSYDMVQVVPL